MDDLELLKAIMRITQGVPSNEASGAIAKVRALLAEADGKVEKESVREQKTGRDRLDRSGHSRSR